MEPKTNFVNLTRSSGPTYADLPELNNSMAHSLNTHADDRFSDGVFSHDLAEESEGHALRNGLIGVALVGIGVAMEVVAAAAAFYGFTPLEGAAVTAVAGAPIVLAGGAFIKRALRHGRAATQELDRVLQTMHSTDAMIEAAKRYR